MRLNLLLLLFLPVMVSAQKTALDAKSGTIVIKGKIGTINPPMQLWVYMGEEKWDTIPVIDGKFHYTKTTQLPAYGAMMVKYKPYHQGEKSNGGFFSNMDLKSLFFESGTMEVSSNVDSLKRHAKFKGSKIQDEQETLLKKKASIRQRERKIAAAFNNASAEQLKDAQFVKDYEQQTAKVQKSLDSVISAQIRQFPNSLVSQIAFMEHLRTSESSISPAAATALLEQFPASFKKSASGKSALAKIENLGKPKVAIRIPAVGEQAPDFVQNSPDGKLVSLKDFSGKYILIDFWASWCAPCRKVNPELVRVFNKFKAERFNILGVSLDQDKTKWVAAIAQDKLEWVHCSDLLGWNNAVSKMYGIQGIPQNLLLDPDGKIIAKNLSTGNLELKLAELLKQ